MNLYDALQRNYDHTEPQDNSAWSDRLSDETERLLNELPEWLTLHIQGEAWRAIQALAEKEAAKIVDEEIADDEWEAEQYEEEQRDWYDSQAA